MFTKANPANVGSTDFETLRAAVNDKSWVHLQDYRMVNGWYVYGGRRTWDTETFPREFVKLRNMAAVRDRYVWDIAQEKKVAPAPDDSNTGELFTPETRFGLVKYSESPEGPRILSPEQFIASCTVPPGFEIKLFADEKQFPELAKPVQLGFDAKGRLWLTTMPTYPMWKPGDPKPADKILILEDTNRDGKADKCTTFYDKLLCPTGFEFWNGGVLVVDQPRLIFLKDTDRDDQADEVVHLIDGWATQDTHHTINAFEFGPGGLLYMLEGVSMSTTVETPWGPFRNFGSSGSYVLDPRSLTVRHFNTPGYGNPWCYVFNDWGQGFCGDGTGANQHWDTPLSGAQYRGRKGLNPVFPTESMRPVVGSEFLVSRHFPDDVQGQFIYACVINTNGMPRWTFSNDGGGYLGTRVRHDPSDPKTAFDLIKSTDKHFRPVDPHIGPDGALWFGDWANPLIGHMQYSQRDPNRDHKNGRIYRLVFKDKPLLTPVTQFEKSETELLDQLRTYEWRHPLRSLRRAPGPARGRRPARDQSLGRPSRPGRQRLRPAPLRGPLGPAGVPRGGPRAARSGARRPHARRPRGRRAGRVGAGRTASQAQALLIAAAGDEHPRVRTEACRALSFFATPEAIAAVLKALRKGSDYWVQYTAEAGAGGQPVRLAARLFEGRPDPRRPGRQALLNGIIAQSKTGAQAVPYLQILLGKDPQPAEARSKAIQALSDMRGGNAENGKTVFRRNCIACHKVSNEGADYGPQMDSQEPVGKRLTRYKIVESIIDPNADVDPKYLSTALATADGKTVTGLLVSETKDHVVLFDGKEKRQIKTADIEERTSLKQSSMPEGLAATMAPVEFLDVVAFLSSLR